MRATRTIERRPLLAAAFADWRTTQVDVRAIRFGPGQETGIHSHPWQPARRLETGAAFHEPAGARILRFDNASPETPLEFVAMYLLQGDQPLIEMA
ncbi:MAG TPA: hypothetical protein VKA83_09615 [Methylomirabilota bacterium]|jgi:quercetin dioxygenase-like cupin family protein|nr:hypothetical protein [Methylomirabilota bacterium]